MDAGVILGGKQPKKRFHQGTGFLTDTLNRVDHSWNVY